MDIDMSILRALERDKEISLDIVVDALEQALLTAYHKTPGAKEKARVEIEHAVAKQRQRSSPGWPRWRANHANPSCNHPLTAR